VERPQESYSIVDAKLAAAIKSFSVFILFNNIFDTEYYEKDNVIMPRSNFEFGLTYTFR
jgi:iron complex outermembrane receptor protein